MKRLNWKSEAGLFGWGWGEAQSGAEVIWRLLDFTPSFGKLLLMMSILDAVVVEKVHDPLY